MVDKETGAWAGIRDYGNVGSPVDNFHIAQWIVTTDALGITIYVGLDGWAVRYVYDTLY